MDTPFQSHRIQDIVYKKHKSTLYSIIKWVFKSFHFIKNWQQSRPDLNKNLINKRRELSIIKTSVFWNIQQY